MATSTMPSAEVVFDTLFAYQRSAALNSAIELDLFTAIDGGDNTTAAIAKTCGTSERGARILCDYLTTIELLAKSGDTYQPDAGIGGVPQQAIAGISQHSRTVPLAAGVEAQFRGADRGGPARRRAAGERQYRL